MKDGVTRRVLDRFAAEGIPIASATSDVTVHLDQRSARPADEPVADGGGGGGPTS